MSRSRSFYLRNGSAGMQELSVAMEAAQSEVHYYLCYCSRFIHLFNHLTSFLFSTPFRVHNLAPVLSQITYLSPAEAPPILLSPNQQWPTQSTAPSPTASPPPTPAPQPWTAASRLPTQTPRPSPGSGSSRSCQFFFLRPTPTVPIQLTPAAAA